MFRLKTTCILVYSLIFNNAIFSQSPVGAWERYYDDNEGRAVRSVVIFSGKFQSIAVFDAESGDFIYSNGGTWKIEGNIMTEKVEFDTADAEKVGQIISFEVIVEQNHLILPEFGWKFTKIDDGSPGKLNGAWVMSSRLKNGQMKSRDTDKPRKTMKILSGTRFQWIAFNTETKEFNGTGGGTYTTKGGKYFEEIEFFSRDNSKSGLKLVFDYDILDDKWIHKGKTSKGNPLHEIWIKRKK